MLHLGHLCLLLIHSSLPVLYSWWMRFALGVRLPGHVVCHPGSWIWIQFQILRWLLPELTMFMDDFALTAMYTTHDEFDLQFLQSASTLFEGLRWCDHVFFERSSPDRQHANICWCCIVRWSPLLWRHPEQETSWFPCPRGDVPRPAMVRCNESGCPFRYRDSIAGRTFILDEVLFQLLGLVSTFRPQLTGPTACECLLMLLVR